MTIKEKFLSLVSKEKTNTAKEINYRIKNRNKIKESQDFSIKILIRLDELNLSVEDFCLEIGLPLLDFNEFCKGVLFLDDDIKNKIINYLMIVDACNFYLTGIDTSGNCNNCGNLKINIYNGSTI